MDNNVYYEFGYDVFGPTLYGFSRWLKNCFHEKKYNKVFFLARDGYLMEKAFQIVNDQKNITVEYVYFSRKSIRQALFWKCKDYQETLKYMPDSHFLSAGGILDFYGFSLEEQTELAERYKLELNKDYAVSELNCNQVIFNLYDNIKDSICNKSKAQYDLLIRYFEQIGMTGECAIVDIGWLGNMQYYLEEFIRLCDLEVSLDGYFFGIYPTKQIKGNAFGYMFSLQNLKLRKSILCFFGICERLFQSREGSTKGYIVQEQIVKPLIDKYEYNDEIELKEYIISLQTGALKYVEEHKNENVADEKLIKKFVRFGKWPTLKQLKLFQGFYNVDGIKVYYLPQKSIFKFSVRELIHGLSNSTWKTGYMKKLCKLPFPYYWIYCLVRK